MKRDRYAYRLFWFLLFACSACLTGCNAESDPTQALTDFWLDLGRNALAAWLL